MYLDFEHVRREFPTYLESKELKEFKGKAMDDTLIGWRTLEWVWRVKVDGIWFL